MARLSATLGVKGMLSLAQAMELCLLWISLSDVGVCKRLTGVCVCVSVCVCRCVVVPVCSAVGVVGGSSSSVQK